VFFCRECAVCVVRACVSQHTCCPFIHPVIPTFVFFVASVPSAWCVRVWANLHAAHSFIPLTLQKRCARIHHSLPLDLAFRLQGTVAIWLSCAHVHVQCSQGRPEPYMCTVCLVIFLPKTPYIHCICIILANPKCSCTANHILDYIKDEYQLLNRKHMAYHA